MIVVSPGGLQSALDEAASTGDWVRCENGANFSPNNVTVPAGVRLDARGATFDSTAADPSGTLFTFASGGFMQGGYVEASDTYDGEAFVIEAGSGETISGTTGPQSTHYHGHTPYDGHIDGVDTALVLRANDGGTIDGVRVILETRHSDHPIHLEAYGTGVVRNCDLYAWGMKTMYFCKEFGDGTLSGNTIFGHNQPRNPDNWNGYGSKRQWWVDAPNAQDEYCEGYLWDSHRQIQRDVDGDGQNEGVTAEVSRASGNIKYGNAMNRTEEQCNQYHCFYDHSGSSDNRAISLNTEAGPSADGTRDQLGIPSNAHRFETRRFYQAAGLLDSSSDGGSGGGGDDGSTTEHTLTVQGTGDLAGYTLAVSGEITGTSSIDSGGAGQDTVNTSTASGGVDNSGSDGYSYTGSLDSFHYSGDLQLFIDGSEVNPDDYAGSTNQPPSASDDSATVSPGGTVTIDVLANDSDSDGSVDTSTVDVLDSAANGTTTVNADGSIDYTHDGGNADSDAFGYYFRDDRGVVSNEGFVSITISENSSTSVLTIESDDGSRVEYEFTVSGDTLEKSTEYGASINSGDSISGNTATGIVAGGRDSYEFSGDLETFAADGNTTIYLDGERVDIDGVVRTNTLTIERGNDKGGVDYAFSVNSDDVTKSHALDASINGHDEISDDGSSVSGRVYGGRDSYEFSGDLTDSSANGDLIVYMNGRVIR